MPSDTPRSRAADRLVEVKTPARLHLGMLSFGSPSGRSFGGVGVMVDRPGVHLRMRQAREFRGRGHLIERALHFAHVCGQAWNLPPDAGCEIEVVAAPRAHVGLGSGTQLALAVAAGMRSLHVSSAPDADPGPQPGDAEPWHFETRDAVALARAVGRARRSSVGLYGFARGGMIVEAGRFTSPDDRGTEGSRSPMVARVRLPSAWRCVVIVERHAEGLSGEAERQAFRRLAPVPRETTAELSRLLLMELLPAAVEGRFDAFSEAVHAYGTLAGEPFAPESARLPHAEATAQLIELLGELGVVGRAQSSWGPAVMAVCESLAAAGTVVEQFEALGLTGQFELSIAKFDSDGAVLRVVE